MTDSGKKNHSVAETVFTKSVVTFILNTTVWVTLVDGVVIGIFLGSDAVAAYGLVWPVVLLFGLVTAVLSGGTRTLYSQLTGQGEISKANKIFTTAALTGMIISVAIIIGTVLCADGIAALLGATGKNSHLRPYVSDYIKGLVFEVPFFCLGGILSSLVVIDSDFKRAFYARMIMSVFDIGGDLLAVLYFKGGMFLLGFTTAIAQFTYFAVMCTHFLQKKRILRLEVPGTLELPGILKRILENGLPAGLTSASGAVGGILANRILTASAASIYVVAYSVHISAGSMMGVFYMCVADAVWTLSGIYYGEEDAGALRELQRAAVGKGLLFNIAAAGMILLLSRPVALLFAGKGNEETLMLATDAVRVQEFSLPLFMLVYTFKSYLMGVGRKRAANVFSVLTECFIHVLSVFLMILMLGGKGAWVATPVKLLILLLTAIGYVVFTGQGKSFREKCLLLPPGFLHPENKEISGSVDSMEGVMNMVESARQFCMENGLDGKTANALMLCIEEMGDNIIKHGFHDGKMHSIDIRIMIGKDKLILRIRDNCRPFDPVETYKMTKGNDSVEETGLKIIMSMSDDVQYISSVGTNNLMITLGRTHRNTQR